MKNRIFPTTVLSLGLALASLAPQAKATVLVQFNFNASDLTASTVAPGLSLTDFNAAAPVDNLVFGTGAAVGWGGTTSFSQPGISGSNTDFFYNRSSGSIDRFAAFTLTYTGTDSMTLDSFTFNSLDTFGAANGYKLQYKLGLASTADRTFGGSQTTTDITGSTRSIASGGIWRSPLAIDLTTITLADRTLTNGEVFSVYFVNTLENNSWSNDNFTLNGTVIPEPTTAAMLLFGGVGLLALRRRRA